MKIRGISGHSRNKTWGIFFGGKILNRIKWAEDWFDPDSPDEVVYTEWAIYFLWLTIFFKIWRRI